MTRSPRRPTGAAPPADGRIAARARHPSARWCPSPHALRDRLAARLVHRGAPFANVGAALVARRGADGDSLDGFAARLGIDRTVLERAEAGECPLASLPASLRRLLSLSGTSEELPR